jgi:hypothetical protein
MSFFVKRLTNRVFYVIIIRFYIIMIQNYIQKSFLVLCVCASSSLWAGFNEDKKEVQELYKIPPEECDTEINASWVAGVLAQGYVRQYTALHQEADNFLTDIVGELNHALDHENVINVELLNDVAAQNWELQLINEAFGQGLLDPQRMLNAMNDPFVDALLQYNLNLRLLHVRNAFRGFYNGLIALIQRHDRHYTPPAVGQRAAEMRARENNIFVPVTPHGDWV